ncbi:MAG: hypothetical protein Roseis2KO_40710 [Roseivirga sp.]
MLYIKFTITDSKKYTDFQKVYDHMVQVRHPGFTFEEEEMPELDWDEMTDKEIEDGLKTQFDFSARDDPEAQRYGELIPGYANAFLEGYLRVDNAGLGPLGMLEVCSILNYLEFGFEVDMDKLEKFDDGTGLVEFSTGNYPYGGMERFLMTLKAFGLIPVECFNGFCVYEFDWTNDFEHEAIELPEKTKAYLKTFT